MSNNRWDDDDIQEGIEMKDLLDRSKKLKQLYSTDIFDGLLDDTFIDYEDMGHLLIDIKILTPEDREEYLQLLYALHDAEEGLDD
jgi:hypothetical protein